LPEVSINVLHIDTERGWRGGERQVLWLAEDLARRGYGTLIAARPNEPLSARARDAGIECIDCAPTSELDVRAAWRLRRTIIARKIDLVHAHTAHAVALAALATVRLNVPTIVARRVDFRLRDNAGTRWKYGRATAFIAVSKAVERVLHESGIPAHRIHVVPDGVDVNRRIEPASGAMLKTLGVALGKPLVVQVAQLVGHKDPINFVRAIARVRQIVPDIQALLVGEGTLRYDVEREIVGLELEEVVHLAGYRIDADELLAAADIACLSSREEGMGSVLLDAFAFGIPVAATSAGGIPDIVVDGETGVLAEPRNPVALGNAIARLLGDRKLASRLAANARARADDFSVERMSDRTIAVYEEVLNGIGGRRSRTSAASPSSSASVTQAP
jgi:glycosyltransferase involved in cell wall biosynthesis